MSNSEREPTPSHRWSVHPARSRTGMALFVVAVIVALGAFAFAETGSAIAGLLAVSLLVVSLRQFFFPTYYILDEQGITVRSPGFNRRLEWNRVERFRHDSRGAFLSTRARPSLLDSFTGLTILWNNNATEIVPLIEQLMRIEDRG